MMGCDLQCILNFPENLLLSRGWPASAACSSLKYWSCPGCLQNNEALYFCYFFHLLIWNFVGECAICYKTLCRTIYSKMYSLPLTLIHVLDRSNKRPWLKILNWITRVKYMFILIHFFRLGSGLRFGRSQTLQS